MYRVLTAQGNRENGKQCSLSYILLGKTQGIWKFYKNTEISVCSSCKFPDSKEKIVCDICQDIFNVRFSEESVTTFLHWRGNISS